MVSSEKWSQIYHQLRTHSELVSSLVLFVTVLVWFGFWAHIGVDAHHDGILLKPASDVAGGQMLFRDTFTQYGALTTLLQAWACQIFGVKLMTIRWLTVFFYAGSAVLVWTISRRILNGLFRIVPILLIFLCAPFYFWTFHSWSSVYALFFLLLTCQMIQSGLEKNRPDWFWCLIGVVSILGFWCRQPLGLVFLASCFLVFLSHWRFRESWGETLRRMLFFMAGAAGVSGIFLIWLAMNHAIQAFWDQSIGFAFSFAKDRLVTVTKGQVPAVGGENIGTQLMILVRFVLFFFKEVFWGTISAVVVGWFSYLMIFGIRKKNLPLVYWYFLPVVLLSGISLHQYYPVQCIRHLYWAAFPGFLVYARTLQAWLSDWHGLTFSKGLKRTGGIILLLALACWLIHDYPKNDRRFSVMASIYDMDQLQRYEKPGFLNGVWMMPWEAKAWDDLHEAVMAIPEPQRNELVLNFSPNGLYLLEFPNQKNWHPQYVDWGNGLDPNFQRNSVLMLLGGRCNLVMFAEAMEPCGNGMFRRLTHEETMRRRMILLENSQFALAKEFFPDQEFVEYPEYKAYGAGIFRTVKSGDYAMVIAAPTGVTKRRSRVEAPTPTDWVPKESVDGHQDEDKENAINSEDGKDKQNDGNEGKKENEEGKGNAERK